MGRAIDKLEFAPESFDRFEARLQEQLLHLKKRLAEPEFGDGVRTLGAEVELCLIDSLGRPVCRNVEILEALPDTGLALEINQYNLELNLRPVFANLNPFSTMADEMRSRLKQINASLNDCRALAIGILPTLTENDFGTSVITPENRYAVLSRALRQIRGKAFNIAIQGDTELKMTAEDVTLEGANTSMQIHVRVSPTEFADWFNAIQLTTPVVLGLSANSPLLFGHPLWHETRIPLFRQSIDGRSDEECTRSVPSRVDLGSGWVRQGAYELFSELVHLHPPLLPIIDKHCPIDDLSELRLHCGTIWPWNRPVYDPAGGGHLRIELRSLPAGPSVNDMFANAAFHIGLAASFVPKMEEWTNRIPFETLASDFYEAARHGINAQLYWPGQVGLVKRELRELADELLTDAQTGLGLIGVDDTEIRRWLEPIAERISSGQNGAVWQRRQFERLRESLSQTDALSRLVQIYGDQSGSDTPVAHWHVV